MPVEGLLGLLFVVRRASLEPEVIFQHPSPIDLLHKSDKKSKLLVRLEESSSLSANTVVDENGCRRAAEAGGLLQRLRDTGSTGSCSATATQQNPVSGETPRNSSSFALCASSTGWRRARGSLSVQRRTDNTTRRQQEQGNITIPSDEIAHAWLPCNPALNAFRWEVFGVDCKELGNLLLPGDLMCNQGFELEVDAGPKRLPGFHVESGKPFRHLRFVCFPVGIDRLPCLKTATLRSFRVTETVEKFSVVMVFDSRAPIDVESIFLIEVNLSKALLVAEEKFDHLTREVNKICGFLSVLRQTLKPQDNGRTSTGSLVRISKVMDVIQTNTSLAQNLVLMYKQLQQSGSARLLIAGCIACHVTTYPMQDVEPPEPYKALALLRDAAVVQQELPVDGAASARMVVDAAKPHKSVRDMMVELCLPLSNTVHICQHLIFWRVAKIVDKVSDDQTFSVNPEIGKFVHCSLATEFTQRFSKSGVSVAEFLAIFGQNADLSSVRKAFFDKLAAAKLPGSDVERRTRTTRCGNVSASEAADSGADLEMEKRVVARKLFKETVDWLVTHDVVCRVRRYFLFVPFNFRRRTKLHHIIRLKAGALYDALRRVREKSSSQNLSPFSSSSFCGLAEPPSSSKLGQFVVHDLEGSIPHDVSCLRELRLRRRTIKQLVSVLRTQLSGYPQLEDFSDDDLLTIYFFVREQQYIAVCRNDSRQTSLGQVQGKEALSDIRSASSVLLGCHRYDGPDLQRILEANVHHRVNLLVEQLPWKHSADMEESVKADLADIRADGFLPDLAGGLLFMLDFVRHCIIQRRVDELSIEHELSKLHCDVRQNPEATLGGRLFQTLIKDKQAGVFSDSIVSYEC